MIVLRKIYLFFIIFLITPNHYSQAFSIARIHYNGGGDWYGDPSSLPNYFWIFRQCRKSY